MWPMAWPKPYSYLEPSIEVCCPLPRGAQKQSVSIVSMLVCMEMSLLLTHKSHFFYRCVPIYFWFWQVGNYANPVTDPGFGKGGFMHMCTVATTPPFDAHAHRCNESVCCCFKTISLFANYTSSKGCQWNPLDPPLQSRSYIQGGGRRGTSPPPLLKIPPPPF